MLNYQRVYSFVLPKIRLGHPKSQIDVLAKDKNQGNTKDAEAGWFKCMFSGSPNSGGLKIGYSLWQTNIYGHL